MVFGFFFFKQKTAYEMRISDWSSDVCSSDLRALALYQMATFGGMALGSWLWGVVAEIHQVGIALIVAGLVQIVALVVALPFRLTEVDDLALAPMREFSAPDPQVADDARSGPVVITITHTRSEDKPAELQS